jgi:predicted RNA-binding protein YlxR (DUF448 family)
MNGNNRDQTDNVPYPYRHGKNKVTGKPARKPKHIPQRTCVGCRSVLPKRTLVRLVRQPEGVQVDPTGKASGRGAYLHNLRSCWEKGLKGSLATALRTTLTPEDMQRLGQFMQTLPEEPVASDGQI